MKTLVAVLGRQPLISLAELEALGFLGLKRLNSPCLAEFEAEEVPDLRRLGGTLKLGEKINLDDFLKTLPVSGKLTLGVSDFSPKASSKTAQKAALGIKKRLQKQGRDGSVRIIPNQTAVLSLATSLHNKLYQEQKIELLKNGHDYYRVLQISNIEAYARRDRERPARDAKVGMLPPKLAQILINLCGPLQSGARVLDPFCGTGVVLQEASLMGYRAYGTDKSERMVTYSARNLKWLAKIQPSPLQPFQLSPGDATNFQWEEPIDAVACECYLGPPMSQPPAEIKLRQAKQECGEIILGFLKNLSAQIRSGTPVVVAVPAWLRPDGHYARLFGDRDRETLDVLEKLRYNVYSFKNLGQSDLLYHREGQVVAREIIVLRKS